MERKSPSNQISHQNHTVEPSDANIQRYACARAAVAGAVSGFLTASRRVDATNRTLWTWHCVRDHDWASVQATSRLTRDGPFVAMDCMGILEDNQCQCRQSNRGAIDTDLCKILSRSLATASLSSATRCSSVIPLIWVSSSSRYCSTTKRTSCWRNGRESYENDGVTLDLPESHIDWPALQGKD